MLRSIVSRSRALRFFGAAGAVLVLTPALPVAAKAETGIASIYSSLGVTASGRSYSTGDSVAAHKTLPLGSIVQVENLRNGRTATVTIVDRGPYISGRIIDVTPSVADRLGFRGQGLTPTRISVVGRGASTGPYDRRGSGSGKSVASAASSSSGSSASSKAVKTASLSRGGSAKRVASLGFTGDSSIRVASMRDGS